MNKVYHGFSKSSGVYKITNKDNGLVYFGQAVQLATRAMQHETTLNRNKHANYHLQAAWNKYGSDVFEFEVIAVYPDRTERDAAEQVLIDEHYGPGCYNMKKTVLPAQTTWSHTPEETRTKISQKLQGHEVSKETREKISQKLKGCTSPIFSEETRTKLSVAAQGNTNSLGSTCSTETKGKISQANKGNDYALGHLRSPETRARMSAAQKAWRQAKKSLVNE